jgi:two-component system, chemotaxis family, sensor kinase Cph1
LERTNHELAEFARITAHDLSAPLLALSRLVELLSDRGEDPEFAPTVGAIRSGISRMRGMVDSVMGYAQSLEAAPARAPVDLDDVLAHVLDVLAEDVAGRRANITASELPTVPGDGQQLERVLLNLVSNALKFAGERPPRISVTAHRQQRMWWISVSDDGIGVAEADRAHIFDLFARSRSSASGRGIGLATCRRIIELHGGRIWVEPNEPRGSIFHFTLPTEPTVSSG